MVAGFLGVDVGGMCRKMHGFAVWCLLQNPKSSHPVEKSAPKNPRQNPHLKICTQNPHQNPRLSSQLNTHRDPQRKGHKGCPLSYTLLLLVQVPENQKNHTKNPIRDSGGNLMAAKRILLNFRYLTNQNLPILPQHRFPHPAWKIAWKSSNKILTVSEYGFMYGSKRWKSKFSVDSRLRTQLRKQTASKLF